MPASAATTNNGRHAPVAVPALTVLVFTVAVLVVTAYQRAGLRDQALRRDAQTFAGVVAMELGNEAVTLQQQKVALDDVPPALFIAVLRASKFPGVLGVRIYDAHRRLTDQYMMTDPTEPPPAETWARVTQGEAVARLHPAREIDENAGALLAPDSQSVVEAWVPLQSGHPATLIGVAQFWVDGKQLAADLAQHDQRLWLVAGLTWFMGSLVIIVGLTLAFQRLAAVNRQLGARGDDLQRANRELVLAAKTSALGAVTAHLMHELKNPLAGLELLVSGQAEPGGSPRAEAGDELAAASVLTRRLRTMVNDVVGVLRDEQTGADFELTMADVMETVVAKTHRDAADRGVEVVAAAVPADLTLPGRRANLAGLVLRNLVQNALEATPRGGAVRLQATRGPGDAAHFVVADGGPGLPAAVQERLFQPCATTKVGGSGLGLALSYQLAQQAGGSLELLQTGPTGTSFRLVLVPEA
jgi:signal transduction histidine kinase